MFRRVACFAFVALVAGPSVLGQGLSDPGALSSETTVAVGPSSSGLTLFRASDALAEAGPALPSPGGFAFLPIDLAGRLDIHRFDPTRPRRILTDDGLSRILLPGGTSIFHYSRGGISFGFLAVGPDGLPRILLELPGTGIGGATDPFQPFLAASRDGTRAAAATTLASGGAVWLLAVSGTWLAGGALAVNVGAAAPLAVDPGSLAFAAGALFFTAGEESVFRASPDGSAPGAPLALPPSGGEEPVHVEPEFAVSDDGSTVAFLAGETDDVDIYLVRPATGPAANLTQDDGEYRGVGYAPGSAFGPTLALAPDGSSIAYLHEVMGTDELFLRPTTGGAAVQITGDATFEPYIDNVVVITIGAPAPALQVEFAAGDSATLQGLDLYRADAAAGLNVVNLTGTSGVFTPPFEDTSTIAISDAFLLPDSSTRAIVSSDASGFTMYLVDTATASASTPLAGQSWTGGGVGPAGGRIFFDAVAFGGSSTVYSVTGGAAPSVQTVFAVPTGIDIEALTASPSGSELAFVASAGPGLDIGARVVVSSGGLDLVNRGPASFLRSVAYSPAGSPGFAVAPAPGAPASFLFLAGGGILFPPIPSGTGFFLR
ncbi:MAG TPA: hypothetical protein VFI25_09450 [Planctomycetota bacterium]|nr:hypothetical protein [Planctomycetota bacterium]